MSEIATLEKLELHLAQVPAEAPSAPVVNTVPESRPVMSSARQGSQLEIFFSEIQYATFVSRKKLDPKVRQAKSSNSAEGALKYRLRLH